MNVFNLSPEQMLIAVAALGFGVGVLVARVLFRGGAQALAEDPRNHRIRQLEADMRLLRRQHDEAVAALDNRDSDYETSMATVRDLNAVLAEREAEVGKLSKEVRSAVAKTRELRQTLAERAAETLREHVRAEEAETELEVVKAGSDVMAFTYTSLQADGEDDEVSRVDIDLLADEDLLGTKEEQR